MSQTERVPASTAPPSPKRAPTPRGFLRRAVGQPRVLASSAVLLVLVLVAAIGPQVAPHDPLSGELSRAFQPPGGDYLLGGDDLGRDILSRLLLATRISLLAAFQAVLIAFVVGVPVGLLSGYFGGLLDSVLMKFNDAAMSFPALILAIVIVGILGPSLTNAMIAIGAVYAPRVVRVVRGSTLAAREELYVKSAQAMGCAHSRVILRHILPNILSPLIVQMSIMMGLAILAEASLSFLGLGVEPPIPSWGQMLGRAFQYMYRDPFSVVLIGAVISATVLCLNVFGDGIRDAVGSEVAK